MAKTIFFVLFVSGLFTAFVNVPAKIRLGSGADRYNWYFILDKPQSAVIDAPVLAIQVLVVLAIAASYFLLFLRGK